MHWGELGQRPKIKLQVADDELQIPVVLPKKAKPFWSSKPDLSAKSRFLELPAVDLRPSKSAPNLTIIGPDAVYVLEQWRNLIHERLNDQNK